MAATREGGLKAMATNKKQFGESYPRVIGKLGGTVSRGGGFASDIVGEDGLTGKERSRVAGSRGGLVSRRTKDDK